MELLCPDCSALLAPDGDQLRCAGCGAVYPVVDGIPRLMSPGTYWGEIERADARRLLDDAKARGWRNAVASRFDESDAAWISILDWQRASWIPLLALPKESVVLDVGSGYGAITHALAAHFDEVHSIEAIPERVEFTKVRVAQEGLDVVHLVQGSALRLPFPPNSFDAIVVNGVLEWIGDWDLEGTPRSAQVRFLRRLHALLKPAGRLLVGIENRIGYQSITGAIDHSGLPYTNLLPRPLATAAVRVFASRHHRMEAPSRSYRTYTYSQRGYGRLFRDAQFDRSEGWWAEPGYNLPYRLVPLTTESVAENLIEMQTQASAGRGLSVPAHVKRALAKVGLLRPFVPEFVFIVHKAGEETSLWQSLLPAAAARSPQFSLTTRQFGTKTTIRAFTATDPGVMVKCSTPAPESQQRLAAEYADLQAIAERAALHHGPLPFDVPKPLTLLLNGHQLMTVESRSPGVEVSKLLFQLPPNERLPFLQSTFGALSDSAVTIAKLFRFDDGLDSAASWIDHAKTVVGPVLSAKADCIPGKYGEWGGHGDFTVENVLLDQRTNRLTVIDWEFVRGGLPPLYDLFTLTLQILDAVIPPPSVASMFDDPALARLYTAFFHANEWSALFKSSVERACRELDLDLDTPHMWDMFVDFLILRIGYLVERKAALSESRHSFLKAIGEWESAFQL